MRIACSCALFLGCAAAAPAAPVCLPSPTPTSPDLAWVVDHAHRVVFEHASGGMMTSQIERYEIVRADAQYYGVAMTGGRDASGKFTSQMRKLDLPALKVSKALVPLATARRGNPDTNKIVVDGTDTYLSWSLTIDDEETCESRLGCRPARSIRLTSRPDAHGFYLWYAWDAGGQGLPIDRKQPDETANALLDLFTRI